MKDSNFELIDYDTILINVGLVRRMRSSILEISIMDLSILAILRKEMHLMVLM